MIIIPITCRIGRQTQWCTAPRGSGDDRRLGAACRSIRRERRGVSESSAGCTGRQGRAARRSGTGCASRRSPWPRRRAASLHSVTVTDPSRIRQTPDHAMKVTIDTASIGRAHTVRRSNRVVHGPAVSTGAWRTAADGPNGSRAVAGNGSSSVKTATARPPRRRRRRSPVPGGQCAGHRRTTYGVVPPNAATQTCSRGEAACQPDDDQRRPRSAARCPTRRPPTRCATTPAERRSHHERGGEDRECSAVPPCARPGRSSRR